MTDINFKPNYGYAFGSPFWMVFRDGGYAPSIRHDTAESAEQEAARIARMHPSSKVYVLAAVAELQTSPEVIGERFDVKRLTKRPEDTPPDFSEVDEPAPIPTCADLDDGQPF